VTTAVNSHASYDSIFLMKAEQTPKQVRSNILKKNKRPNAVIQCTEMDSVTVCTVYRDGECHCVYSVQRWTVSLCAQLQRGTVLTVCTVYRGGQCHCVHSVREGQC